MPSSGHGGAWLPVLLIFILLAPGAPWAPPASHTPAPLPLLGDPQAAQPSQAPNYDEQVGITFTDSYSSMKVNVTAVPQSDNDGYGPAYLLNGLTNNGYWYQVGLSWNWDPGSDPGTGFGTNYEVFDPNGDSIFPVAGGGGLLDFSGPVNQGDPVALSLNFSGGDVVMSATDLTTGSSGAVVFSAEKGSMFVGLLYPSNPKGFFTGLMTEEYHSAPYYGSEGEVTYTNSVAMANGFLWADEFSVAPRATVFYASKFVSFQNPSQIQRFSSNGTSEYADASTFITGALDKDLLTLSYAVSRGGSGFRAPTLNYTAGGERLTATITRTPTTFFLDPGTAWQVSALLSGSTQSERWSTDQQTNGTVRGALTENLTYYRQFLCTFSFSVLNGGTAYSSPQVRFTAYGSNVSSAVGSPVWVDAGSTYLYSEPLPGSTSTERWASANGSGTVTEPRAIATEYYHQLGMTLNYSIEGGGSPGAPEIAYAQFGRPQTSLVSNSTTYFLDPGSSWSVSSLLPGSASAERWVTTQPTNGTASSSLNLTLLYVRQFSLTVAILPSSGGSALPPPGWFEAGASVALNETAAEGWQFQGWNGTGAGSYSGHSSLASLTMNSHIQENATFYPGLQVSSGSGGGVSYGYGGKRESLGSNSASVVFAPPGTRITISATPSSFFYVFVGWSLGPNTTAASTALILNSPSTVHAAFAPNIIVILGMAAAALLVSLALAWLALHRRRSQN